MKHVFITGSSTGIGFAIVNELVKQNYFIHASVRNTADSNRLNSLSSNIRTYVMDVSNHSDIIKVSSAVKKYLGKEKLSVLINNAGIAAAGPIESINLDKVKQQFEVNVFGVINIIQQFIPLMNENDSKIINMSSKSGQIALPFTGAYAASKFALEAISDALRRELSNTGIQVVLIQPGVVRTPIWEKANEIDLSEYKNTRYSEIMTIIKERVIKGGRNGADPNKLAELIRTIIKSEKPKLRYIFAKKPFFEIRLLRLLPSRILDKKIRATLFGKKNS